MPIFHNDTSDRNVFVPMFSLEYNMKLKVENFAIKELKGKENLGIEYNIVLSVENKGMLPVMFDKDNNNEKAKMEFDINLIKDLYRRLDLVNENNNEKTKMEFSMNLNVDVYNSEGVKVG